MKTRFTFLLLLLLVPLAASGATIYADDYVFQKQLIIDNQHTCQAFRIHADWFATAAHCVESCLNGACRVKILLAQGDINASFELTQRDVFVPKEYRTVDKQTRVTTHKNWDVALLHYRPAEYQFEFAEGGTATLEEFNSALQQDRNLRKQWKGALNPQIPVLYSYGGEALMTLQNTLVVPRWNWGTMEAFYNPETVLYFGEKQALWGADGFGVDHGNSGGAVVLPDGGVVGIATAKAENNLPSHVRQAFPQFGKAADFFLFNGFAPKTTLKFIEQTLLRYGDRVQTQKLRKVKPTIETLP